MRRDTENALHDVAVHVQKTSAELEKVLEKGREYLTMSQIRKLERQIDKLREVTYDIIRTTF